MRWSKSYDSYHVDQGIALRIRCENMQQKQEQRLSVWRNCMLLDQIPYICFLQLQNRLSKSTVALCMVLLPPPFTGIFSLLAAQMAVYAYTTCLGILAQWS
mmetsp:Transcript_37569/g.61091  ORF Transcript_37569/g.61091 Transcript_37569/m.61091 type:complete len:101 (+) Transcript_37569:1570-1872(+)